jgi:hypothetical protein
MYVENVAEMRAGLAQFVLWLDYGLDDTSVGVRFLGEAKIFLYTTTFIPVPAPHPPIQLVRLALYLGIKRQEREAESECVELHPPAA